MKEIKILGTGCPKCEELAKRAENAAQNSGIEYKLEKVKEINDILAAGAMITPALMIDGEIKVAGKIPTVEAIKEMLD